LIDFCLTMSCLCSVALAGWWKKPLVSMQPRPWPEIPELTARVARAAFPKGTLAIRIRDALGPLFADEEFADMFGVRGRLGLSPGQLALVSVLQYAENLSDRQAADAVRGRIEWKYALGLELEDPGFDFSVLSGFRARLVAHGQEEHVLQLLLERLAELGFCGGRQRTDSTHVLGAVRSLNRVEFVGEVMRAALNALAVAAPRWLAAWAPAAWQERYGQRADTYRLPDGETARTAYLRQAGVDGYELLERIHDPAAPAWLRQIPAVQVLRESWVQQFYREAGRCVCGRARTCRREDSGRPRLMIVMPITGSSAGPAGSATRRT
jgi:transposase